MNHQRGTAALLGAALLLGGAPGAFADHSVGGFLSEDDGFLHAITLQPNGDVREVYWNDSHSFYSSDVLANFGGMVAVAGFYSTYDHYRHAIVALSNNAVWEVYYHPVYGEGYAQLFVAGSAITAVSAYESRSSHAYHVVVGLADGTVRDYSYGPVVPTPSLSTVFIETPGTVREVAGFSDGSRNHVVAMRSDEVNYAHERVWDDHSGPGTGSSNTLRSALGTTDWSSMLGMTAFYAPSPNWKTNVIATVNTSHWVTWHGYDTPTTGGSADPTYIAWQAGTALPLAAVAGFWSRPSGSAYRRHIVTRSAAGGISDVMIDPGGLWEPWYEGTY